jgi:hypothetical protein
MGGWKSFWKRRVDATQGTCSRIRRGLTHEVNLNRATFSQLFSRLSVFQSGQLPFLGGCPTCASVARDRGVEADFSLD